MKELPTLDECISELKILRIKAEPLSEEMEEFKRVWLATCAQSNVPKVIVCTPDALVVETLNGATFEISMALKLLKLGHKITRALWIGTGMYEDGRAAWLSMEDGKIRIHGRTRSQAWDITQEDLLAEDYRLIKS